MLFFGANRRSGTTWLSGMLNHHPEVHIRNEGWLVSDETSSSENWIDKKAFGEWAALGSSKGTWMRRLTPDEAMLVMHRAMLAALLKEATLRDNWKKWDKLRWVGDKTTTHYCARVDLLHRLFPDARFLCMVRDGRDAVVSDLFLTFRNGDFKLFRDENMRGGADALKHAQAAYEYHALGQGRPVPLFTPPILRYYVNVWLQSVAGGLRARELYGPAQFTLQYEQLVADPFKVAEVFRWLGVSDEPRLLNEIVEAGRFERFAEGRKPGESSPLAEWRKGVVGDWRTHFTESDKSLFKQMAGEVLVELGYEQNLDW